MTSKLRLSLLAALLVIIVSGVAAVSPRPAVAQAPGDLAVTKTGPATIAPGGIITYTITISNVGTGPRELIGFTDSLPANTTFVS